MQGENLGRLVRTALVLDHYPRIEDKDVHKPNVGNMQLKDIDAIVLYFSHNYYDACRLGKDM